MTLKCHETKVPEALSTIADHRIEIENPKVSKCFSSSRNKFYTTEYRSDTSEIYSNDNMSYYTDGYVGYPAIAHLLATKVINYDESIVPYFSGIKWKDLNQKNKNDYEKTCNEVFADIESSGWPIEHIKKEIAKIVQRVNDMELRCILPKRKPPEGY